jgi:hypothetical protein
MDPVACKAILLVAIVFGATCLSPAPLVLAQTVTPDATGAQATRTPSATASPSPAEPVTTIATATPTPIATPTPTVTPTMTPTPTPPARPDDPTAILLEPAMAFLIVLGLLGLAVFALARLFTYLTDSRKDYYATVREFARKGVFFNPLLVTPTTGTVGAAAAADVEPVASFDVAGPGVIALGQSAVFSAHQNGSPASATQWELRTPAGDVVPPDSASLDAPVGSTVTVTAAKSGTLMLIATLPAIPGTPELPGTPTLLIRTLVTVLEPPPAGEDLPDLPFIGQGFGSIISAIVIVAALVVLAATRAIDADVVGVVLGALAGYLFGVGVASKS